MGEKFAVYFSNINPTAHNSVFLLLLAFIAAAIPRFNLTLYTDQIPLYNSWNLKYIRKPPGSLMVHMLYLQFFFSILIL